MVARITVAPRTFTMTELKYVKTNLKHRKEAQEMLRKFMRVEDIAVTLVSEPYVVGYPGWHTDLLGRTYVGVFR